MVPEFTCPVHPIPIVGTLAPSDFHVSPDWHAMVVVQLHTVLSRKLPSAGFWVPIGLGYPCSRLPAVSALCPTLQLQVGKGTELAEGSFGGHRRVVACPAADDWVEMVDQCGLGCSSVCRDDFGDSL